MARRGKLNRCLNRYLILVDNAMLGYNERRQIIAIANYGVELHYARTIQRDKKRLLLKTHGSLNWFSCPVCSLLSLGVSRTLASTYKVTAELFAAGHNLADWYTCHGKLKELLIKIMHVLFDHRLVMPGLVRVNGMPAMPSSGTASSSMADRESCEVPDTGGYVGGVLAYG